MAVVPICGLELKGDISGLELWWLRIELLALINLKRIVPCLVSGDTSGKSFGGFRSWKIP